MIKPLYIACFIPINVASQAKPVQYITEWPANEQRMISLNLLLEK